MKCATCQEPAHRKCAGCSKVWFCSKSCQKSLWISHIFECNPRTPIHTGHHLVLACHQNQFPEDHATSIDYGFAKAFSPFNRTMLLALYTGLVKGLGVTAAELYKWKRTGTLVAEIKARAIHVVPIEDCPPPASRFSKLHRNPYYAWFLENQHILDDALPAPDLVGHTMISAWRFMGQSTSDTKEDINMVISSWPQCRRDCFNFYQLCLIGWRPSPSSIYWAIFGFCALLEHDEHLLAQLYSTLFHRCTFDAFVGAYEKSALIALFDANGLESERLTMPYLEDVLRRSPYAFKSVWHLKKYVVSEEGTLGAAILESPARDYGFPNCKSEQDVKELKEVYRQILTRKDANPLKLHEAGVEGKLFEYASTEIVGLKKKFKRFMKYPYP